MRPEPAEVLAQIAAAPAGLALRCLRFANALLVFGAVVEAAMAIVVDERAESPARRSDP
jgi:hypothetical protein